MIMICQMFIITYFQPHLRLMLAFNYSCTWPSWFLSLWSMIHILCAEVGVANCLTEMDGPLDSHLPSSSHVSEPKSRMYWLTASLFSTGHPRPQNEDSRKYHTGVYVLLSGQFFTFSLLNLKNMVKDLFYPLLPFFIPLLSGRRLVAGFAAF